MTKQAKPIPDGYHALTPYFTVRGVAKAIEFYKQAFGAEETVRMATPDGNIMHAEVRIGGSTLMLGEEDPHMPGQASPLTLGAVHAGVMIYCDNVDKWVERATKAGATVKAPPADMFWGDRFARIADPFGYLWSIATHIKDLTPEEMQKGQDEFMKQMAQGKK